MRRIGIVSYNIHCNFTNYGSALQSWALQKAIDQIGEGKWEAVIVDYCPESLRDKNVLNPMEHMWNQDGESRRMCALSMPAIRENAKKFDAFYRLQYRRTNREYHPENFHDVVREEALDGFVCGSDTIFCIDEFGGFDDGFYANYPCMQKRSVAYAASFGDAHFSPEDRQILAQRLRNFRAIGLRENTLLAFAAEQAGVPVRRVLDPTLLLTAREYDGLAASRQAERPYLLLYARRYDPRMEAYAEKLAGEHGWEIIEISLRAVNAQKHRMFYEAGVEEFLSLVKHAEFVVTNSFHGAIFSVQYQKEFAVFSREQCDTKITQLFDWIRLPEQVFVTGNEPYRPICYAPVQKRIEAARKQSAEFLRASLSLLEGERVKRRE